MLGRRLRIEWWMIATIISVILVCAQLNHLTRTIDLLIYDRVAPWRAARPDPRILLVEIDEYSLARLGRWPWPRTLQAKALEEMAASHPAVIAYDILLVEPGAGDKRLAAALRRAPVLLPLAAQIPGMPAELPSPEIVGHAAGMGNVILDYDRDGIVRRARLGPDTLAELVHRTVTGDASRAVSRGWSEALLPFNMAGAFRRVPYAGIASGEVPARFLEGRILLVGATAQGLGDLHPVAADESGRLSGIEIQANIINGLLADRLIRPAPAWITLAAGLIPTWLMMIGFWYLRPSMRLVFAGVLLIMLGTVTLTALTIAGIWLAPSIALFGMAIAYPLWSWRRLAAINRFLSDELLALRTEPGLIVPPMTLSRSGDSVGLQTMELHMVIEALRTAMHEQEKTLEFLSHDMRAPQSAILTILDARRDASLDSDMAERIRRHARHGLKLAEDFVQLARLRAAPLEHEPVELGDAFAEAIDMVWQQVHARPVQLHCEGPIPELWVRGDRWALVRTLANLLDNAVKFAPPDSTVRYALFARDGEAVCTVADSGPGLSPQRQRDPFARFGPRDRGHAPSEGVGLGLAFVKTTVDRHDGTIAWHSAPGEGTRFTITLPLID